jgi:hypothetical protein
MSFRALVWEYEGVALKWGFAPNSKYKNYTERIFYKAGLGGSPSG